MLVLDMLNRIFRIVLPIYLIVTIIRIIWGIFHHSDMEKGSVNKETENHNGKTEILEDGIYTVELLFALCIIVVTLLKLILSTKYIWIFIIAFALPLGLYYIAVTFLAIRTLGNIVNSNSNETLSDRERLSIQLIACATFSISISKAYEELWKYADNISNSMISDMLYVLLFVGFSFLYIFLILSLIATPIFCGIRLLKSLINCIPFRTEIKKCGDFFVSYIDEKPKSKPFVGYVVKFIKDINNRGRILLYLLLPFIFAFDVARVTVVALSVMMLSNIGYIVFFFRAIKESVKRVFSWILKSSDKHIVAASFRLALIFALVSMVILNRYQPIFKSYEASTAVFEFVASAIIIPMIFEWISSIKKAE